MRLLFTISKHTAPVSRYAAANVEMLEKSSVDAEASRLSLPRNVNDGSRMDPGWRGTSCGVGLLNISVERTVMERKTANTTGQHQKQLQMRADGASKDRKHQFLFQTDFAVTICISSQDATRPKWLGWIASSKMVYHLGGTI